MPNALSDVIDMVKSKGLERRLAVKDYVFDTNNDNFQPNDMHNQLFIKTAQHFMNDKLHYHGHVFLNDVLSFLGIKPRSVGQLAGWDKRKDDFIEIKITQTMMSHGRPVEYFLEIKHSGIILFDVLGD